MALSQKHRVALYEHFVPDLGEEATEALLSEFPNREGDELVTRTLLRAEMADLRTEVQRQANKTIVVMVAALGVWTGVIAAVT